MLGASLGDSMGSYCEFSNANKDNHLRIWKEYNSIFGTAKGQLTDDSEMAISLALGNLEIINKTRLKQDPKGVNFIANYYFYWYYFSEPFDIGTTTSGALKIRNKVFDYINFCDEDQKLAEQYERNSIELNQKSKSNGFLMRHTPMSVLIYYDFTIDNEKKNLFNFENNDEEIKNYPKIFEILYNYVKKEINLTHSNNECVVAAVVYDFLILKILFTKDQKMDFESILYIKFRL